MRSDYLLLKEMRENIDNGKLYIATMGSGDKFALVNIYPLYEDSTFFEASCVSTTDLIKAAHKYNLDEVTPSYTIEMVNEFKQDALNMASNYIINLPKVVTIRESSWEHWLINKK